LGLLAQHVWARDPKAVGKRATRKQRPLTAKESQKWLRSVEAVSAAHANCPQTRFICIGDREADVYDLFRQERPAGVELLVRAAWNRRVDHPERYLWAKLAAQPVVATLTVRVPRRGQQPARRATVVVRWCGMVLCPPTHRRAEKLSTLAVWAVQALEAQPPAGCEPLEWLLLTTAAVHTTEDALARVDWYACRWGIETSLGHLKTTMPMKVLHGTTVPGVLKELTLFAIVSNLVRMVRWASAMLQHTGVERISFLDAPRWLGNTGMP